MRALIVAASGALRSGLRDALRAAGFQVVEAAGADEAMEILRELGPMDLGLVEWSPGMEVVEQIRADRELRPMRLVMVTSEFRSERLLEALRAGADDYLLRPFSAKTLELKLDVLGLRRGRGA